MDSEQDYIELHRLLAKCKWSMNKQLAELNSNRIDNTHIIEYCENQLKKLNDFMTDIPIIIKGDEFQ